MTIFEVDVQDIKDSARSGIQPPHESFAVAAISNGWIVKVTDNGCLLAAPETAEQLRDILIKNGV